VEVRQSKGVQLGSLLSAIWSDDQGRGPAVADPGTKEIFCLIKFEIKLFPGIGPKTNPGKITACRFHAQQFDLSVAALNKCNMTSHLTSSAEKETKLSMSSHNIDQHKQADADGRFRRQDAQFRSQISKDGPFPPEKDRYILYCALICPWACRTLIVRSLKGLDDVIGMPNDGFR